MSDNPVSRLPPAPLTPQQQAQLLDMRSYIARWVAHFSQKYRNLLEPDDVGQLVNMAAAQALRTWRPEHNVLLAFYAWKHVCGTVIRAARKQVEHRDVLRAVAEKCMNQQRDDGDAMKDSDAIVLERAHALSDRAVAAMMFCLANEASVLEAMEGEEVIAERQMRAKVRKAVEEAELLEKELSILELHYVKNLEIKEAAEAMQVGYSSARRIHNDALTTLGERLRAMGIAGVDGDDAKAPA